MKQWNSIAVGIDFSPASAAALRQAVRMGQWSGASVRAVHVLDATVVEELESAMRPHAQGLRESLRADVERRWKEFASSIAPGVEVEVAIAPCVKGFLKSAAAMQADLLVVGAGRDKVGPVALGIARHAAVSVLVARDTKEAGTSRVLACVDFSEASLRALECAARVARGEGAELNVIHFFDAPWHVLHYRSPTPEAAPEFQEQYIAGLKAALRGATERLSDSADLRVSYELVDAANYRGAIPEFAEKVEAGLICLGTTGRSNLRDLLLGSTAERVIRSAHCSVLAVR